VVGTSLAVEGGNSNKWNRFTLKVKSLYILVILCAASHLLLSRQLIVDRGTISRYSPSAGHSPNTSSLWYHIPSRHLASQQLCCQCSFCKPVGLRSGTIVPGHPGHRDKHAASRNPPHRYGHLVRCQFVQVGPDAHRVYSSSAGSIGAGM
jgi:hypothetical protein